MKTGDINGHIDKTGTEVKCHKIGLILGADDAWALCNALRRSALEKIKHDLDPEQFASLERIGIALGKHVDY